MKVIDVVHDAGLDNVERAKRCLSLISDIAGRCVRSQRPSVVCYAIQELSQVLFDRSGTEKLLFAPMQVDQMSNLELLLEELEFVDFCSRDLAGEE